MRVRPAWLLPLLIALLALAPEASWRSVAAFRDHPPLRGDAPTPPDIRSTRDLPSLPAQGSGDNLAEFSSAGTDSFVLAGYTFDGPGGVPDWQGWTSVDRTALAGGVYWHVDSSGVPVGGGNQAMWCGVDSTSWFPCAPGYGNSWWQLLRMTSAVPVQGDVTFSFLASWDTEPEFDYLYIEYQRGGWWEQLASFDAEARDQLLSYVVPAARHNGTIRFRFRFESDPVYSDEDCEYETDGAVRIDNIVIADASGTVHAEDFEDEIEGATQTDDGLWVGQGRLVFGDYARLVDTHDMFVDCVDRRTHAFGFLADGLQSWCYELPDTVPLVPHGEQWSWDHPENVLLNEARSPAVSLLVDVQGDPVDPSATRVILEFSVYRDFDSWDHALVYYYRVRGFQGELPDGEVGWWESPHFLDGTLRDWYRVRVDITDLIGMSPDHVQVALGARDISPGCDVYECGGCTANAPLFDDVRVLRVVPGGIRWSATFRDVFQDDFPPGGLVTGPVRMDAAGPVASSWTARDSSVVTVVDDVSGLGVEPSTGTPAVYLHVRSSGGQHGAVVLGDDTPYLSDDGQWTVGVCAPMGNNKFACDLADELFEPGDSVTFYFSAVNGFGARSYFSVRGGATVDESRARASADEAECLPSGRSDVLYIDAAPGTRAEGVFEAAFRHLGLNPDRIDHPLRQEDHQYVALFPPRTRLSHLKTAYRTIVLSSGDWRAFTPDFRLIAAFLDSTSAWDPGLYLTGAGTGHMGAVQMVERIGVNDWGSQDHFLHPLPISPDVAAVPGGIFDHAGEVPPRATDAFLATNRDCVTLDGFDVLSPSGTGTVAMTYAGNPAYPATIISAHPNPTGRTMRAVTDGFGLERIRDVGVTGRAAYLDHLEDVLEFLRGEDIIPTPVGGSPPFVNRLDQNVPNPFNPSTRIGYSIARRGRVRIDVYDVSGRRVRTLVDATQSPVAGGYSAYWDGTDARGARVASGVYFYRIEAPGFVVSRKMVILK